MKNPIKEESVPLWSVNYGNAIQQITAVRETEHCYWFKRKEPDYRGNLYDREKKARAYVSYFRSWQEAYDFLLARALRNVQYKRDSLARAEDDLAQVQAINKPTDVKGAA